MSQVLGILGLIVLFVVFGLTQRKARRPGPCGMCPREPGPDCACDMADDVLESIHGSS